MAKTEIKWENQDETGAYSRWKDFELVVENTFRNGEFQKDWSIYLEGGGNGRLSGFDTIEDAKKAGFTLIRNYLTKMLEELPEEE